MARMKEDEIAAIEATAKDYGLEQYPINGAELDALIKGYRHFEKLAKLAAPTMIASQRRNLNKIVQDKVALHRVAVLLLAMSVVAICAAFSNT